MNEPTARSRGWTENDLRAHFLRKARQAHGDQPEPKARRTPQHLEMDLHRQVAAYLGALQVGMRRTEFLWYHVPNEGRRSRWEANAALSQGMRAGVSDWVIHWRHGSLFLEGKTGKGRLSKAQEAWQYECESVGVPYVVFMSLGAFVGALEEHGLVREGTLK